MNQPHSPRECVEIACQTVDEYLDANVCYQCALNLAAHKYKLDPQRLRDLYLNRLLADATAD